MRNLLLIQGKYKKGSNQYIKRVRARRVSIRAYLALLVIVSILSYFGFLAAVSFIREVFHIDEKIEIISPLPRSAEAQTYEEPVITVTPTLSPTPTPKPADVYVSVAVDEFFTDPAQQSEMRMIMHCLLYRETKHDLSKGHGDNGKAGGPLQYWQGTWDGYRELMISEGYADDISTRYNLKEAIRTTVWAIKHDRAKAWGPIYRAMQGRTDSICPVPSWYSL